MKLADGRSYEAPVWTELEQYIRAAEIDKPWPSPIVAAMIDDELRELTYHIERDVEVTPLGMDDRDGSRVYRRSLTLLLVVAVQELFPEARLRVDHSVTFGGYYCEVEGRPPFTAAELARIEDHMRAIVAADAPIGKQRVPLADAIEVFRRRGDDDMVRLMRHRRKDFLVLYDLRGVSSYFHGYMVPSTGYLRYFSAHAVFRFGRVRPALPAPQQPGAGAGGGLSQADPGVSRVRPYPAPAGDRGRGRAGRRDPGRPHRRDHPGRRGAARTAHRPHRHADRRAQETRCAWC